MSYNLNLFWKPLGAKLYQWLPQYPTNPITFWAEYPSWTLSDPSSVIGIFVGKNIVTETPTFDADMLHQDTVYCVRWRFLLEKIDRL